MSVTLRPGESTGAPRWMCFKANNMWVIGRGTGWTLRIYRERRFWMVGFVDGSKVCAADFFGLGPLIFVWPHGNVPRWLRAVRLM